MLAPGLSARRVRQLLAEHELGAPDELVTWFEWSNGWHAPSAHDASAPPIPYLENSSLEDALSRYDALMKLISDPDNEPDTLDFAEGWLPLSHDNWGRFVYCNGAANDPPLVRRTNPEPWDPTTIDMYRGRSMCTLVEWSIQLIETEAALWNRSELTWMIDQSKLPPLQASSAL
ncbi:hypothetical protein GCM10027406_14050 [Leifsonia lichenia]